jgi:hypothetical protein
MTIPEATLLIHGWSSNSQTYINLKSYLIEQQIGDINTIIYADYESREDNITFNDIIHGLNDRLREKGFIDFEGNKLCNLNVIVHSTGGLIIRNWIWRYYYRDKNRIDQCPVQKIVMLAPANFGSPLAHRGKSLIGALTKGRRDIGNYMEVGKQILDGLELGSKYQWDLAHKDLILAKPYFNASQIQVTVLVGDEGFEGFTGLINKPGTDGTVVIAGTSLNSAKLTLDFCEPENPYCKYKPYDWALTETINEDAFAVLPNINHDTIIKNIETVGPIIVRALRIQSPEQFLDFKTDLEKVTKQTFTDSKLPQFQQFLVHATDDQDTPINDFTIEFFITTVNKKKTEHLIESVDNQTQNITDKEFELSQFVNQLMSKEFHTYSLDSSFRRFLVNKTTIEEFMNHAKEVLNSEVVLSMRVYVPDVDRGIKYATQNLQNIVIHDPTLPENNQPSFFYNNTTTLIELKVNRHNDYVTIGIDAIQH